MIRLLSSLEITVNQLIQEFDQIERFRKGPIEVMARFIARSYQQEAPLNLMFVCTHNSRRSHLSQIWAQMAAYYFGFQNIRCYSGGTEETAFYKSAVQTIGEVGFRIDQMIEGENPIYEVTYSEHAVPLRIFSKYYNTPSNPQSNFIAVVNCSKANEDCPDIVGNKQRFSLIYPDPKRYDRSSREIEKYREICTQIGRELLYLFHCCREFAREEPVYA